MTANTASIVDAQRFEVRSVVVFECSFWSLVDASKRWHLARWYEMLLSLLKPIELDVLLAPEDA